MTTLLCKSVVGPQSLGTSTCSLTSKFKQNSLISNPWCLQHGQVGGGVLVKDMKASKSPSLFHKGFYIHASNEKPNNKVMSTLDEEILILTKVCAEVSLIHGPNTVQLMLQDGTTIKTNYASQNDLRKSEDDDHLVNSAILLTEVIDERKMIPIIGRKYEVSMVKNSFVGKGVPFGMKNEWNMKPARVVIGTTDDTKYKAKIIYTTFRETTEAESYIDYEVETNSLKEVGEFCEHAQSPFLAIAFALVAHIPIYVTRRFMETYRLCTMDEVELRKIKNASFANLNSNGKRTTKKRNERYYQMSNEEKRFAEKQLMLLNLRLSIALKENRHEDAKMWQYEYEYLKTKVDHFNIN